MTFLINKKEENFSLKRFISWDKIFILNELKKLLNVPVAAKEKVLKLQSKGLGIDAMIAFLKERKEEEGRGNQGREEKEKNNEKVLVKEERQREKEENEEQREKEGKEEQLEVQVNEEDEKIRNFYFLVDRIFRNGSIHLIKYLICEGPKELTSIFDWNVFIFFYFIEKEIKMKEDVFLNILDFFHEKDANFFFERTFNGMTAEEFAIKRNDLELLEWFNQPVQFKEI